MQMKYTEDSQGWSWILGTVGVLTLGPVGAAAAIYAGHRLDKHLNNRRKRLAMDGDLKGLLADGYSMDESLQILKDMGK